MRSLKLLGARTHNLKGVDLELFPGTVVALTGVSGAGKSSLALDTLYAEGQRRFVESFSPYARQFLERLERPPIDRLEPVPAAVAVDRAAPVKSSRSTVATMTDLEPLLAGLFLRESKPTCPEHQVPAVGRDVASTTRELLNTRANLRAVVTYHIPLRKREHYLEVRERLVRDGYRRMWFDEARDIDELKPSEVIKRGGVDVIVDRLRISESDEPRLAQAVETAWQEGTGAAHFHWVDQGGFEKLQQGLSCPICARQLQPASPGLFSYDSPLGACQECRGFGRVIGVDLHKVIPDPYKSLAERAIRPWNGKSTTWERRELKKMCERHGIAWEVPWRQLPKSHQELILHGDGSWNKGLFPGVLGWFKWLETRAYKMHVRVLLSRYRSYDPCPICQGLRLNPLALSYRLLGESIGQWHQLEINELRDRLEQLNTSSGQGELLRTQLRSRLDYLHSVGLGYLTLDRQARTLSGGEAQRVTLTAALGTSLHNALFVLDEPSVGLHAEDVARLNEAVLRLAARNNIVLLIEHDPQMISAADRVIELGPEAGDGGGRIEFDGSLTAALKHEGATARSFQEATASVKPTKTKRTLVASASTEPRTLRVQGARANNLKDVTVDIPLDEVVVIAGPSGSGKSTLIKSVLYPALGRAYGLKDLERPGDHDRIDGFEKLQRVTLVDQSPLGRTSRGNAATYTKAWDAIRKCYAALPSAERAGLSASHFSFNVDGGRCEACAGEGFETVEMQFLADVRLECPVCRGQRFKQDVLRISYRGVSIADVLNSSVRDTLTLFADNAAVQRSLGPLLQLGLGYLKLGQPLSTLSGGEAQRLKLARALGEKLKGTLLLVDEPSAGLHADEVDWVIDCLRAIKSGGGSVVVVDHDLRMIRAADWVIELGPGSGKAGGSVVAATTPAELAKGQTATGRALQTKLRIRQIPRAESGTDALHIENAREHNLREVSAKIPHSALTVVTGPSGSGKSSLVFDVMFAEGQRRFLETLSPYARRFLPRMPKPDVDQVSGVPPAVALEQRTTRAGVNSTVATVTEVAHYLRLLFAKLGTPHCPDHQEPIGSTTREALIETVRALKGEWQLLAPVVQSRKGTYLDVFTAAARAGIEHAYADQERVSTDAPPKLKKSKEHDIDLLIAEGRPAGYSPGEYQTALDWGRGSIRLRNASNKTLHFSTASSCPVCGLSIPALDPRFFSFNTVQGRCELCEGHGIIETTRTVRGEVVTSEKTCPSCNGARLAAVPRSVTLFGQRYHELLSMSVREFRDRIAGWRFAARQKPVGMPVHKELLRRVEFMLDVGLDYLSLDRAARTLSGGEMQRLRLSAQLGAGLTGALYVLDEPTIGLHPRDTRRLIKNLRSLVELGSTVVVVEHDVDTIRAADYLIDMGPGGGSRGGQLMASGNPRAVLENTSSPTARSFREKPAIRAALTVCKQHPSLSLRGVRAHNLQAIDVEIPLARLTVVAGVSGSGKSTLVRGVLLPALRRELQLVAAEPLRFDALSGHETLSRAVSVDQSPIGRTPRSVPATFLGIWDGIRKLFAATPDAKMAGFGPARFSFNTPSGGRCKTCDGQGVITHEMSFLPDVVEDCPVCRGQRFEPETLRVRYLEKTIGEVLKLTAEEAAAVFDNHPSIQAPLLTLADLGAGYIQLGQGSHTLSGGEAQRLKLATELTASKRHEPTLYVLDEPTTGLHQSDVAKLTSVLERLVERGDTLVVIEHHPWVIAGADHVIELGPEGGQRGGQVVASCTPRELAKKKTATGKVIKEWLK